MEQIINELANMLVEAQAKVDVITELLERFKPAEVQETEGVATDFVDETQPITSNF